MAQCDRRSRFDQKASASCLILDKSLLQELDRVPEAIERYGRAIALRPYDPSARFNRGAAYAISSQNDLARADLERVLELDTSGTQYGNLATGFLDILDGLDAKAAEAGEAKP